MTTEIRVTGRRAGKTAAAQKARLESTPVPNRMRGLPVTPEGYVVPWFVAWEDGVPDFRVIREEALVSAWNEKLCFLCGQRTGRWVAFPVGPMCTINRVSAEPPGHRDCVEYALTVCPFLTRPNMVRRGNLAATHDVAGVMIERNPGVTALWVTETGSYTAMAVPPELGGGVLFNIGEPREVAWWTQGGPASRGQVVDSMVAGFPVLVDAAKQQGGRAPLDLGILLYRALGHLPGGRGDVAELVERFQVTFHRDEDETGETP